MEEEKKLYPFSFLPVTDNWSWGSEDIILADLGYRDSQIAKGWLAGDTISELMEMYMDRVSGEEVYEFTGRQFPVCARKINASGRMPLMVCPSDDLAIDRYDSLGKVKFWYVTSTSEESGIYLGFKEDVSASEFYSRCLDGSVEDMLNVIRPKAGDWYVVAPGTVHSAFGNVGILEISESSPLDFCLTGWGKVVDAGEFDDSFNLIEALDFIDFGKYEPLPAPDRKDRLLLSQQFNVSRIDLKDKLHIFAERFESFLLYTCIEGAVVVSTDEGEYPIAAGESLLIPSELSDFYLAPDREGTLVLETAMERMPVADPYIDNSVPADLDGEPEYGDDDETDI